MTIEQVRTSAGTPAGVRGPRARPGQMCIVVGDLADGDGSTLSRQLRQRGMSRVMVLARSATRRELVALLAGGVRGAVAVQPRATAAPSQREPERADRGTGAELTAREIGVLDLVASGRSNRQIGTELGLSALTVKSHLARISRKLGTGDRAELVAIAIRAGVLR